MKLISGNIDTLFQTSEPTGHHLHAYSGSSTCLQLHTQTDTFKAFVLSSAARRQSKHAAVHTDVSLGRTFNANAFLKKLKPEIFTDIKVYSTYVKLNTEHQ